SVSEGRIDLDEGENPRVKLSFEDGSEYPIEGYVDFLDFSADENMGTMSLRAEFANPGNNLLPGEFVRARIYLGEIKNGIMIPQRAVQLSERDASVYIIDTEGKAAVRPVELGPLDGQNWIIKSGLKIGDKVIISNLQKIGAGAPVKAITKKQAGNKANHTSSKSHNSSMSRFFIDQPIFAWVIALGILIVGLLALRSLPIEQYPAIAPPSLTISVTYPCADVATLEQNVIQII